MKGKPLTYEQFHAIAIRPFPEVTRHQVSYPWAGTIVADDMWGDDMIRKKMKQESDADIDFDNSADAIFAGWVDDVEPDYDEL